jgi:hypothetical protein
MTFLAILALLFGIFMLFDGAFDRGLLVTVLPNLNGATAAVIRLTEVVIAGMIFLLLGLGLSTC